MPDNKIEPLHKNNAILQKLDYELSQFLLDFAKKHSITNSDIAGVFEAVKFRMFQDGL